MTHYVRATLLRSPNCDVKVKVFPKSPLVPLNFGDKTMTMDSMAWYLVTDSKVNIQDRTSLVPAPLSCCQHLCAKHSADRRLPQMRALRGLNHPHPARVVGWHQSLLCCQLCVAAVR